MIKQILKKIKKIILQLFCFLRMKYWVLKRSFLKPSLPRNLDGKIYLNLGCGVNTSPDFINVDVLKLPLVHYIGDIQELNMFPDNYADMIYASHVVEHISRGQLVKVLKEWRRVLKPGGILRFAVPDFDKLIEVYKLLSHSVNSIVSQLMGAEGGYDDHHTIWNFKFAKELLESIGFENITIWDPEKVEIPSFRDKSSRTIEIGNQKILISLNIEAIKQ